MLKWKYTFLRTNYVTNRKLGLNFSFITETIYFNLEWKQKRCAVNQPIPFCPCPATAAPCTLAGGTYVVIKAPVQPPTVCVYLHAQA